MILVNVNVWWAPCPLPLAWLGVLYVYFRYYWQELLITGRPLRPPTPHPDGD
jgi:hypothetical protein